MDSNLQSFIRMFLSAAAAFIIGKTFWGTPITNELFDTIIAVIMEAIAVVWALRAHTADIEKVQSVIRNAFSLIGGFVVSRGLISAETSLMIVGAAVSLGTYIYSRLSRKKTKELEQGSLNIQTLKGSTGNK